MRLIGTLRNSQSILLSLWLAVLCCSQGIAGQGRAGLRAEVRRKSLRNLVARASSEQDPLGQEQASQAQAPQSSPSPQVQAGQTLFTAQCAFCHGRDAAGGETGPDLTSSPLVSEDVAGDKLTPVIRDGRVDKGMPAFTLGDADLAAVVAFIHDQKNRAASLTGGRRAVDLADLQTGNADAGKKYFDRACARCHSATGDLAGVAKRLEGLPLLQRMLYPNPAAGKPSLAKVTITPMSGEKVAGTLAYRDEFTIAVTLASGASRSFPTNQVTFTVDDPLQAHIEQLGKFTDEDMHNVLAYLQTLR